MEKQSRFLASIVVGGLASIAVNLALVCPAMSTCGDEIIDPGEDCDDGNLFGGDGCAQNCTDEHARMFLVDPNTSGATTQFSHSLVELSMSGSLKFILGAPNEDGTIPFVVPSKDIKFGRIPVPGVSCACVRSIERPEAFRTGQWRNWTPRLRRIFPGLRNRGKQSTQPWGPESVPRRGQRWRSVRRRHRLSQRSLFQPREM